MSWEIILLVIVVIALLAVGAWLMRGYLSGDSNSPGIFTGGRERRVGLVETRQIDGRRKLVLIHRDGVEHLIMTGGPVDVVIETGISKHGRGALDHGFAAEPPGVADGATPSFGRLRQRAAQASFDQG